jgi:hypothetical protein
MNAKPRSSWAMAVFAVVVFLFFGWRVWVLYEQGISAAGLIGGVLLVVAVFAAVSLWIRFRRIAFEANCPGSFVANIAVYPQMIPQLRAAADLLGSSMIRYGPGISGKYATVVIDHSSIRLFGGFYCGLWGKPRLITDLPVEYLNATAVTRSEQGNWVLPTIELQFKRNDQTATLDLTPLEVRWGIPRVVRRKDLDARLASVNAVVTSNSSVA